MAAKGRRLAGYVLVWGVFLVFNFAIFPMIHSAGGYIASVFIAVLVAEAAFQIAGGYAARKTKGEEHPIDYVRAEEDYWKERKAFEAAERRKDGGAKQERSDEGARP